MSENITLPFRIRPLEAKDISIVCGIDCMVFRDPWPESAYVQELYFNPNAKYFVAQLTRALNVHTWKARRAALAAQIVGYVGMRVEMGRGHISTLAVRPDWQGYGLGEFLFHKAIRQAIQNNAQTITLEVRISNAVAQRLYGKYGFTIVSRLRGYYADGEDAYFMHVTDVGFEFQQQLHNLYAALIARLQTQALVSD